MAQMKHIVLMVFLGLCLVSVSFADSTVEATDDTQNVALSSKVIDGKECSVSASVDKVTMYIGDVANLRVEATVPPGWQPDLSKAGPMLDKAGFEIRDFDTPQSDDEHTEVRSFSFSTFTTGTYMIPPVPVEISSQKGKDDSFVLATRPVSIQVVPVPPIPGEPDDIRDLAGPMALAVSSVLWFLLGFVVVLIIGWVVYKKLRDHGDVTEEVIVTPLSAYELAVSQYDSLTGKYEASDIDVKTFHYGLTEILRLYLQGRYSIEVLSETTLELLDDLKRRKFDTNLMTVIETILSESDLVKFARYVPSAEETARHSGNLRDFLEETRPLETESEDINPSDEEYEEIDDATIKEPVQPNVSSENASQSEGRPA